MGAAMFTGVTGLLAHQRRLDVVANNIANVNTTGYRGSRMLFEDLFSQTLRDGTAPTAGFGGTNPLQVGLGTGIASIDVNHAQGSLVTTGVASDLAVQGNGLFVLADDGSRFYTRDGSFQLNANGVLIDPGSGRRVQGYMADNTGVINSTGAPGDITIPLGTGSIIRATANVVLMGNLSSDAVAATPAGTVQRVVRAYDSLGTPRDIQLTFTKQPAPATWQWTAASVDPNILAVAGAGTITFDGNGGFTNATSNQVSITFQPTAPASPVQPLQFALDFDTLTELSGDSDLAMQSQDGFPRGVLESYSIGQNGVINGQFSNGLMRPLAQVAVATFANLGGLVRSGNNMFRETPASGLALVGPPNSGGRGEVSGGVLEQSNVDLGTEFSNLILTQRGFQANARTITAADTLLQEAVNLVR